MQRNLFLPALRTEGGAEANGVLKMKANTTSHCTRGGNSYFLENVVFLTQTCVVAVSARVNSVVMLLSCYKRCMKIKVLFLISIFTVFGFSATSSLAQNKEIQFSAFPSEKIKASEISWKGHFGGRKTEPSNIYILMTQGGFLAPTSKNFEGLIKSWLAEHFNAQTKVVYVLDGMLADVPDSKMKAVWIVDGDANLNIHLVRQGGCPAGTMLLNPEDKTSLTREEYQAFEKKVIEAEKIAKEENLGIWRESKK